MPQKLIDYYEYIPIDADDQNIACHPLVDPCNARIIYRLLEGLGIPTSPSTVLDIGTGTGQVSRLLLGIPNLTVEACDRDPRAVQFFRKNPELKGVPVRQLDFLESDLPRNYDAIVCRGVYHHVPKSDRPRFLKLMTTASPLVIIADEGIAEYHDEEERYQNCRSWYGYVISEARRRGLERLASMESGFLEHERKHTADDGLDFKESPTAIMSDAAKIDLVPSSIDRIGPWQTHGGGFFVMTFHRQ